MNTKVLLIGITLFFLFFFSPPCKASETTLYLGSYEKNLSSGEVKTDIPAGSAVVVKTTGGANTVPLQYLYSDHLGSVVLITDENGNKTGNGITYYPYGRGVLQYAPTDKLYTGQRLDDSNNLYYYNARYYNPRIGHFVSADKAEGTNRYAYVGNNPIKKNDPSGNYEEYNDAGVRTKGLEAYYASYYKDFGEDLARAFARGKGGSVEKWMAAGNYAAGLTARLINSKSQFETAASGAYQISGSKIAIPGGMMTIGSVKDAFELMSGNSQWAAERREAYNFGEGKNDPGNLQIGGFYGSAEYMAIQNSEVKHIDMLFLLTVLTVESAEEMNLPKYSTLVGDRYFAHVGSQHEAFVGLFNPSVGQKPQEIQEVEHVLFSLRAFQGEHFNGGIAEPVLQGSGGTRLNENLLYYWNDKPEWIIRARSVYQSLLPLAEKYPELRTNIIPGN